MTPRPKLSDIASSLGLSVSAVSLALRDSPKIPAATRDEVKRTAAKLGYVYNRQAAELRRGVKSMIGVCINDLANPVFVDFIRHIEDALRQHEMKLLLWNSGEDVAKQAAFLTTAQEYGAAGLLICPAEGTTREDIATLLAKDFPVTTFSRLIDGVGVSGFANDDAGGVFAAMEHLHGLGHRRIGWIGGGRRTSTAENRLAGYDRAVAALGLDPDPELRVFCETSRRSGYVATGALLDLPHPPTGIVAFGDLLAIGATTICRERGLVVGQDVSIVGFDDIDECTYASPPLTTVAVDKGAIARAAVDDLLSRIAGDAEGPVTRLFTPRLVVRRSTGPGPRLG